MDKKAIYEHLADIYLDASAKKKKKGKSKKNDTFRNLFFVSLFFIFALSLSVSLNLIKTTNLRHLSEVALIISPDPVKINFNFDPAKKEIFSINLNKLNLGPYKSLGFSAKKTNYRDNIALRVELNNVFNEKAYVYVNGMSTGWKDYRVSLADFGNISDWSEMAKLSFIIEEWNVREKKDVIYIDNIRVIR